MSCQQASRFITNKSNRINNNTGIRINSSDVINNNKNSVENTTKQPAIVADDPYVFTETVPNLPPVLFNIQVRILGSFTFQQIHLSIYLSLSNHFYSLLEKLHRN